MLLSGSFLGLVLAAASAAGDSKRASATRTDQPSAERLADLQHAIALKKKRRARTRMALQLQSTLDTLASGTSDPAATTVICPDCGSESAPPATVTAKGNGAPPSTLKQRGGRQGMVIYQSC